MRHGNNVKCLYNAGVNASIARELVDAALEITVIPSFTRIGPAIRSRLYDWTPPAHAALAGRTALVTGPTSGLGLETARGLASLGGRVVLVGRSPDRLQALADELGQQRGADRFPIVVADMSSLASVRAAVARIVATEPRIDILIDNAGAIYPESGRDRRRDRANAGRTRVRAVRAP